jgi:voltage-gated potassium channel
MEIHSKRSALIALFLLVSGIIFGISGYIIIEGYTFSEAVYMTIITMGTVGFREVHPLSLAGMWFTIVLIILSLGIYAFAVSVISKYFIENVISNLKFSSKVEKRISKLTDHVILVGYGRNGSQAAAELLAYGYSVVVIDKSPKIIGQFAANSKILHVQGDATEDTVLHNAGIDRAQALITAMPNDADNLFVVITAREMNQRLKIISRASAIGNDKKLILAGASNVIMPDKVGGQKMAKLIVQPDIDEFIETIMLQRTGDVSLHEILLSDNNQGSETRTIGSMKIRENTGANIIGLKTVNKQYTLNPKPETKLEVGDKLFVLGTREQLWHLKDLMCGNVLDR